MTESISHLLFALRESNFQNIKDNIELVLSIFRDSHDVKHRIDIHYEAEEERKWVWISCFDFYDSKGNLIYYYSKYPHFIIGGKYKALEKQIELHREFPDALIIFTDCNLPESN